MHGTVKRMKREIRLVKALLENPKRSDRAIAKILGVSQPTITRGRTRLEEEGKISYIGVPDLSKLGFEILAFSFVVSTDGDERSELQADPNVIFAFELEKSLIAVLTAHRNYTHFRQWRENYICQPSVYVTSTKTDLVKSLTFKDLIQNSP